jgi:hypothetical protein
MQTITTTLKRTPFRLVLRNGMDHPVPVLVVRIDRIAPRPKGLLLSMGPPAANNRPLPLLLLAE